MSDVIGAPPITLAGRVFPWGRRTYVMGVINASPESFSGDGITDVRAAVEQALRFARQGADIIDVGGQSTRPRYSAAVESTTDETAGVSGYEEIPVADEIERVAPVIKAITSEIDLPISVDTYKAPVAAAAIEAGAAMINDVWGLKRDASLASVAAAHGAALALMHNQENTQYTRLIPDIIASLRRSLAAAVAAGVPSERIIIDPGFGFGKTVAHNLEVLRRLREIRSALGRPLLLGTSRKSTIGRVLNLLVDERLEGTAATAAVGIANGADIIRVHDVAEMTRVARMTDAVTRGPFGGAWNV